MIVYVETNFLLELILEQEQAAAATRLLDQASAGLCDLRFPGFSIAETLAALDRRRSDRNGVRDSLRRVTRELNRSPRHGLLATKSLELDGDLASTSGLEADAAESVVRSAFEAGTPIHTDREVIRVALGLAANLQLSLQDAIVLASVIADASRVTTPVAKVFVSKDVAAFGTETVREQLAAIGCRFVRTFTAANEFLTAGGPA